MKKNSLVRLDQLKLRHLHFLIRLVELGNLGRAAEEMAMTQSAASRLLSEMEERFGRPLFDRGRHGMRLLPASAQVLRFAKMVCTEEQQVKEALATEGDRPAVVRIGVLPSIPAPVIRAVQQYKAENPSGVVSISQASLDALMPLLVTGELDLVVGRFDLQLLQPPLQYEKLMEVPLAVVAGSTHPLVQAKRVGPDNLIRFPWVAPVRTSTLYPHFAQLFAGLPLPVDVIESASPLAMHAFLQDGVRLGLMSASMLDQPLGRSLKRLKVTMRSTPGPLGLYQVKGRHIPNEVKRFREILFQINKSVDLVCK